MRMYQYLRNAFATVNAFQLPHLQTSKGLAAIKVAAAYIIPLSQPSHIYFHFHSFKAPAEPIYFSCWPSFSENYFEKDRLKLVVPEERDLYIKYLRRRINTFLAFLLLRIFYVHFCIHHPVSVRCKFCKLKISLASVQAAHLEKESRVASPRIQIKMRGAWVTSALCWKFTGKGESKATASLQQAL